VKLNKLSDYDKYMNNENDGSVGIRTAIENRLFITYISGNATSTYPSDELTDNTDTPQLITGLNTEPQINSLNNYKDDLINNTDKNLKIKPNTIYIPKSILFYKNVINNVSGDTIYNVLDITDYYVNLIKQRSSLIENKSELAKELGKMVNRIIYERLGMYPTIYNVFEIILNDVDKFFDKIKDTAKKAENKSEERRELFNKEKNEHVYPFPLVINENIGKCKQKTNERVSPTILERNELFPELTLVKEFIESFQKQSNLMELFYIKEKKNADGSNIWFPISPLDSDLGNGSPNSPYILTTNMLDPVLKEIMGTVIKRFYILSQGVIQERFYTKERTKTDQSFVDSLMDQEIVNLVNSLNDDKIINHIKIHADKYGKNLKSFYELINEINYTYIDKNNNDNAIVYKIGNFPASIIQYFPIDNKNTNEMLFYLRKENSNFTGFNKNNENIQLIVNSNISGPIEDFKNNLKSGWLNKIGIDFFNVDIYFFDYTLENVLYIVDEPKKDVKEDGVSLVTRFLRELSLLQGEYAFDKYLSEGNIISRESRIAPSVVLQKGENIVDIWVRVLSETYKDSYFYDNVISISSDINISSLMILSNFSYTLGPYNLSPHYLNDYIFDTPAAIEIPNYLFAYVGALIDAKEKNWIDDIKTFTDHYEGKYIFNFNYIAADIHDFNDRLSEKDKNIFRNEYEKFKNENYSDIRSNMNEMYNLIINNNEIDKQYEKFLNAGTGKYYNGTLKPLIKRESIINYGSITFSMKPIMFKEYMSIENLRTVDFINTHLEKYFKSFFDGLFREIDDLINRKKDEDDDEKNIEMDEDIINQTYYSFKNINDKWISNPSSNNTGFPFTSGNLIDSFAFVDRALNPIGDTVINVEILLDMYDNPNLSLYSVISQILSTNGFEFFPLQNFIHTDDKNWHKNTFKLDTSNIVKDTIAFVCMYIGGTSTYPSTGSNGFENDGIIDIMNNDSPDFSSKECNNTNSPYDRQEEKFTDFPFRTVRAFRVKFGEQNQSMFTDIKIDSKEYPETNESIQILSRLAGDGQTRSPTPKGQNLYNLYENRSYKATVTSLGNVMIQPTQYFQLENIPMFNGAYMILDVEHTIVPNKMTTKFSGVKILKYPIPRVTNPVVFSGLGDISGDLEFNEMVSEAGGVHYPDATLLTKYLTFDNASFSARAKYILKISNAPTAAHLDNIKALGVNIFDRICDNYGWKPSVNSMYRSLLLNSNLKPVPGSLNSQHMKGEAMDIDYDNRCKSKPQMKPEKLFGEEKIPTSAEMFYYVIRELEWDQIIWELGDYKQPEWVHISYVVSRRKNRKKISLYRGNKTYYSVTVTNGDIEKTIKEFDAIKFTKAQKFIASC